MTGKRIRDQSETIPPPGEIVANLLRERGMTQTELAQRMGRPLKTVNEIVHGKAAILPETALQLEHVLGVAADDWLSHEARYRAALLRQKEEDRCAAWHGWLDKMPVKELKRLGKLPKLHNRGKNKDRLARRLLDFFGVATPVEWQTVYGQLQIAYRHSRPAQSDLYARAAWLRLGELAAGQTHTRHYDRQRFVAALQEIRTLTVLPPEELAPRLRATCAAAGMVLALVPALPCARVSGAARWINQRPLIQLSLSGMSNDQFWFTFFHEACHVLEHERRLIYMDDEQTGAGNHVERRADQFAADFLIPPQYAADLPNLYTQETVLDFAKHIGVHPGIVVGRLQHEKHIERSRLNDLKETLTWNYSAAG